MKNLIILVFLLSVLTLKAQNNTKGEKLETIYFRNPQYVLQMDKVMYPGYNLKFEKIVLHEYLNNKKVSTTPLKMPARKITFRGSGGGNSYIEKLKTYPSFQEYIAAVATWTSAVDSNAVDFDQELYDNYRIAWNKTDWEEALYYVEEPKDFIIEITREGNQLHNDYFSYPAEIDEFSFEYDARLDENFNIENESVHIYFMDNNDDINLTQLMPVKAENFADSLLNGYKKTSVRLKPILDRKGRQIGTDGDARKVDVIERGYFNLDNNQIHLPEKDEMYGGVVHSNLPLVEYVSDSRSLKENEVFDASGNVYETTQIGDRIWMKENLRSEHFQDGSEIPNLTTRQWATSTKEGIIIDEDMDVTLANKGHRYNGYTVVSEKNVCPYGFWVPDADDIAELYNDVTPYSEYVKIKGNKVKAKRYSSIFYPIVLPVATALNVGWNSIALGTDATLLAGAGAIDLTYNTPWFLADLFLLGPILGWEKETDENGKTKTKYNPLPTFKGNGGFHLFRGSFDLLDDVSGLFYYFRSAPYQPISIYNFYQQFEQKSRAFPIKNLMRYMPVLAQLLKKDETFKDNYDFGLSENNSVRFIKKQEPRNLKTRSNIGITYNQWGVPNMWGVHRDLGSMLKKDHELIAAPSIDLGDDFKLLKMSTKIRCVNDPFYEKTE